MISIERSTLFGRSILARFFAFKLLPGQTVALAALALILIGTLLLLLPFSTNPGVELGVLDAMFTATSAVCVTGLIVMDTPNDFSTVGQLIILLLIQIGGLGYALMATLILLILGHRIGLRDRMMLTETLSTIDMEGSIRYVKMVATITFCLEGIGTILLTIHFAQEMNIGSALYAGLFHAISAFNNAGFALFPNSFENYQTHISFNFIITTLVILGSIGFLVFEDLVDNITGRRFRFQTHTKLVAITTGILLIAGTVGIAVLEWGNTATFQSLNAGERVMASYFQTVSRTAGFTSLPINEMQDATLYFLLLLMAIGGSPSSMAGGIKTTTIAIVCLTIWAVLRRKKDVEIFHRRIPHDLTVRSLCLALIALAMITTITLLLAFTEEQRFLGLMFEVTSALGIVGMSLGDGANHSLSASLTDFGKIMIMTSMLLGRFGPLMIGLFAVKTVVHTRYRLPQSRIVIG